MQKSLKSSLSLIFLFYALLALPLTGCLQKEVSKPNPFLEKWQAKAKNSQPFLSHRAAFKAEESSANATISSPQTKQWEKKTSIPTSIKETLPTQKISVRFVGDSLPAVLRTLARIANENILISPGITGTLDTHIENTPWNVVFMGIIETYGLVVKREANLLHVMSYKDLEQQLAKKNLKIEAAQIAPLVTNIIAIEYSTPEDIAATVTLLLSKNKKGQARGSVSIDTHSRSLVIRDTKENMGKLLKLIYEMDKPTPQILIKAYIIETSKDMARELGVKWDLATNLNGDFNFTTAGDFLQTGSTIGLIAKGSKMSLDMQLSALQDDGKINILSSPSIATLDNNEAILESGTSIPYPEGTDNFGNIIFGKADATLKLIVTPHVIDNKLIKLNIKAKKDEVDTSRSVSGVPFILTKNAETALIVKNRSTVVIAGLTKEQESNSDSGVPILKDIPILGHLFKSNSKTKRFEDLLIFITPTILDKDL